MQQEPDAWPALFAKVASWIDRHHQGEALKRLKSKSHWQVLLEWLTAYGGDFELAPTLIPGKKGRAYQPPVDAKADMFTHGRQRSTLEHRLCQLEYSEDITAILAEMDVQRGCALLERLSGLFEGNSVEAAEVVAEGPWPYMTWFRIASGGGVLVWVEYIRRAGNWTYLVTVQLAGLVPSTRVASFVAQKTKAYRRMPYALPDNAIVPTLPNSRSRLQLHTQVSFPGGTKTTEVEPVEYHVAESLSHWELRENDLLVQALTAEANERVGEVEVGALSLSSEEAAVVRLPTNVLLLGRSGTGKTTCALLRLWGRQQAYNRARLALHGPSPDTALHTLFLTLSTVLCTQVRKAYDKLDGKAPAPAADEDDLLDDHEVEAASNIPHTLLHVKQDELWPMFLVFRKFLLMLDGSLRKPFFQRDSEGGVVGQGGVAWADGGLVTVQRHLRALPQMDDIGDNDSDNDDDDYFDDIFEVDDEEEEQAGPETLQMREIDYDFFATTICPHLNIQPYAPAVVWTEINSFIKGSVESLQSGGYLSLNAYLGLGKKRAPFFVGDRRAMYEIFVRYERYKKDRYYDLQDVIYHIYSRLLHEGYRGAPIHQVFVDEVQDFTQSALYLLFLVCRQPEGFFFTGDTCQTIARGIGFRFADIQALFHKESLVLLNRKRYAVPTIHQLTVNFRSHTNLLNLGHSVVELLEVLFPRTIDKLAKDRGIVPGPLPTFFETDSVEELFVLLSGPNAELEFGAQQVILVRSEADKAKLPQLLRHALCLTVTEAKGLEFEDVILFNFWKNSPAAADWAVICNYWAPTSISPDYTDVPLKKDHLKHHVAFDLVRHALLCSELKHLYTALTRAKRNLYIIDESKELREPMLTYWDNRGLISLVKQAPADVLESMVRATDPAQWREQGKVMLRHRFLDQALKCFVYSGDVRLQDQVRALQLATEASSVVIPEGSSAREQAEAGRESARQAGLYLAAAALFESVEQPRHAARCYYSGGEPARAALLYTGLHAHADAGRAYLAAKRPADAAQAFRAAGLWLEAEAALEEAHDWDHALALIGEHRALFSRDRLHNVIVQSIKRTQEYNDDPDWEKIVQKVSLVDPDFRTKLGNLPDGRAFDTLESLGFTSLALLLAKQNRAVLPDYASRVRVLGAALLYHAHSLNDLGRLRYAVRLLKSLDCTILVRQLFVLGRVELAVQQMDNKVEAATVAVQFGLWTTAFQLLDAIEASAVGEEEQVAAFQAKANAYLRRAEAALIEAESEGDAPVLAEKAEALREAARVRAQQDLEAAERCLHTAGASVGPVQVLRARLAPGSPVEVAGLPLAWLARAWAALTHPAAACPVDARAALAHALTQLAQEAVLGLSGRPCPQLAAYWAAVPAPPPLGLPLYTIPASSPLVAKITLLTGEPCALGLTGQTAVYATPHVLCRAALSLLGPLLVSLCQTPVASVRAYRIARAVSQLPNPFPTSAHPAQPALACNPSTNLPEKWVTRLENMMRHRLQQLCGGVLGTLHPVTCEPAVRDQLVAAGLSASGLAQFKYLCAAGRLDIFAEVCHDRLRLLGDAAFYSQAGDQARSLGALLEAIDEGLLPTPLEVLVPALFRVIPVLQRATTATTTTTTATATTTTTSSPYRALAAPPPFALTLSPDETEDLLRAGLATLGTLAEDVEPPRHDELFATLVVNLPFLELDVHEYFGYRLGTLKHRSRWSDAIAAYRAGEPAEWELPGQEVTVVPSPDLGAAWESEVLGRCRRVLAARRLGLHAVPRAYPARPPALAPALVAVARAYNACRSQRDVPFLESAWMTAELEPEKLEPILLSLERFLNPVAVAKKVAEKQPKVYTAEEKAAQERRKRRGRRKNDLLQLKAALLNPRRARQ